MIVKTVVKNKGPHKVVNTRKIVYDKKITIRIEKEKYDKLIEIASGIGGNFSPLVRKILYSYIDKIWEQKEKEEEKRKQYLKL